MPYVDLKGLPDDQIEAIPGTIALGTVLVPAVPNAEDLVETPLGGGLTRLEATVFEGTTIEVIVRDYLAGPRDIDGTEYRVITGGVIEEVTIRGEIAQNASDLGVAAADLLPVVDAFIAEGDPVPLLRQILGLDWNLDGRGEADILSWDPAGLRLDESELFSGDDTFDGKGGGDLIDLYHGDDTGIGGKGNDTVNGGAGNDTLSGGSGKDKLFGEKGKDLLEGGGQKDVLKGGGGKDTLVGGAGNDKLTGGGGPDRFVFAARSGDDTITDYTPGKDRIVLDGVDGIELRETARGVTVVHEGGTIDLPGLTAEDISTADISGW